MLTFIPEICIDNSQPFSLSAMIRNISDGYIETMFCLRTCSIANYLLEKMRKFCRYLFTKSNGNFTSCLWSSISELMCNIKEITYNTDVVFGWWNVITKKAPNLRIFCRTHFYDKCVCWYSSENLTNYETWLLPLWCYAVGPIHLTRPCKYCDNACEYHEVNNPVSDSTICQWLRWQVASKLLLRSSPLTSYHFGIQSTTGSYLLLLYSIYTLTSDQDYSCSSSFNSCTCN